VSYELPISAEDVGCSALLLAVPALPKVVGSHPDAGWREKKSGLEGGKSPSCSPPHALQLPWVTRNGKPWGKGLVVSTEPDPHSRDLGAAPTGKKLK